MTRIEYVITEDSKLLRRTSAESEITVTQDIVDRLASGSLRYLRGFFSVGGVPVNCVLDQQRANWTIRLIELKLNCPWRLHEGLLVPVFNSHDDPIMAIEWYPPMPLFLTVGENLANHTVPIAWMWAGTKEAPFRMPLPNTYVDGRLCLGNQPNPAMPTSQDLVARVLANLNQTQWNADLWSETENTFRMFRYKPEGEKFTQQPPTTEWARLCTPITGDHTKFFLP